MERKSVAQYYPGEPERDEVSIREQKGKEILVPEAVTMTQYLFDEHRLSLYSYLNKCLRNGTLKGLTGMSISNRKITRSNCIFPNVTFWRINQEDFFADVEVVLHLSRDDGIQTEWKGTLVLWCSFSPEFTCSIEELVDGSPERTEMVMLSPFLIPYLKNKEIDREAESIWKKYIPLALDTPSFRDAERLAEKMGLRVRYLPIYERDGITSILFIGGGKIQIWDEDSESKVREIDIAPNTIVVNENIVKKEHSGYCIYHECFHFEHHYFFFCLQKLTNSDPKSITWKKVIVDEDYQRNDPIYWMERQANRGAYGLMMPVTHTQEMISALRAKVMAPRNAGDLYQKVGMEMHHLLNFPYFRIRARMVQLGHIEAKGAFNYVDKELIQPFAFDPESLRGDEYTFVIDSEFLCSLKDQNEELLDLITSGKFVYADGHVVRNSESCLLRSGNKLLLSSWAAAHVDQCCLRFVRVYVQSLPGRYEFDRMYYDADFHKQTMMYAGDLLNEQNIDIADVEQAYRLQAPKEFTELLEQLREKSGISLDAMAERLNTSKDSLRRWIRDPQRYRNTDFLTSLCLILQTPKWLSRILFKKAKVTLDEDDSRDNAIAYILDQLFMDGIDGANKYLKKRGLASLAI